MLGDDQLPVEPVERFLAYLASIEKSPNTIKAYAHDLKDWFTYLVAHRRDWRTATLEDVAGFVAWLRLPPKVRDGKVVVLPTVEHHCSVASVNRKLAALTSFCGHTCFTRLREEGMALEAIQAQAGHASIDEDHSLVLIERVDHRADVYRR